MKPKLKRILFLLIFLFAGLTGLNASDGTAIDSGATAWMLTSTALVLLMIPGLAMFYGGLVRSKNVLGTIMHSFVAMGIISVLWVIVGYSMCFGKSILGGWIGWNNDYFFLKGIDSNVMDAGVPEYVFSMFQCKFAIITPALIAGAFAERVSFKAYCFFIALTRFAIGFGHLMVSFLTWVQKEPLILQEALSFIFPPESVVLSQQYILVHVVVIHIR